MKVQARQVRSALAALGLEPADTGQVIIDWTQVTVEMHAYRPDGSKVVQEDGRYAVASVLLPIIPDVGVSRGWRAG